MATTNRKWLIIIGASVIVLLSAAYALYRPQVASFSIQVTPAQIEDAVAGQRCVFLVVAADEGEGIGKGAAVDISATAPGSTVTVDPQAITPGQVAEVTVIPDEASANSTLTVTIAGEREGSKHTYTTTIDVWEGLAGPLEEAISPMATEVRDKFISWLAVIHPEFVITDETEWTETIVRPHFMVVMYHLFFSDDWEMGVSWHVTIEPHNWAHIYLRHRSTEVRPSHVFKLSSWSAEEYEISAIDPENIAESVWR